MIFSPLRHRFSSALLFAGFLGAHSGAAQSQAVPAAPITGAAAPVTAQSAQKLRLEVFDQVWNTVNQKYYDPKFKGVDWAAMRTKYRPFARYASDEKDFYDVLNSMLGELRDKHTNATPLRGKGAINSEKKWTFGFEFGLIEGVLAVASVKPETEAARAGVKAGMKVQSIGGKSVADAIRPNRGYGGGGTLDLNNAGQLKFGLVGADGALLEVSLTPIQEPKSSLVTKVESSASGAVVIKFNKFGGPLSDQLAAALKTYVNAPALIIDLRDNPGGELNVCLKLLGYFFNDEISVGKRTARSTTSDRPLVVEELKAGKKGGQLYSGPVAVLISQYSGSASELFASTMQEQHRATIIGTRSAGALLGLLGYIPLKDGGQLGVSEVGFVTAQGRIIEGNGVTPDEIVPLKLADLQQGRDAALEAAKAYFAALKKQPELAHPE